MVGITSYGAYIPFYRLDRAEIGKMWGGGGRGERAVANFDEDSVTMGVAAGLDCLNGIDKKNVDGLYFASTTAPYIEKQSAAIVATALDLRRDLFTSDFSGSLRGGTGAIRAALDAVKAGSADSVLVSSGEMRLGFPNGGDEKSVGDGAGAVLLGNSGVIAEIEGSYSVCSEIIDVWRSDRDKFIRSWEGRFVRDAGFGKVVPETVAAALKKFGRTFDDFTKVIIAAPNSRFASAAAKKLGFDAKEKLQDVMDSSVGFTGTASPLMLLVAALEEAKAGDRLLLASYGEGCDVLSFKVTEEIEKVRERRGIGRHLSSKKMTSYDKYLRWREIVQMAPAARPPADQARPSASAMWRDNKGGLALHGSKCKNCGTPQYPIQRVCFKCATKDNYEEYALINKKAKLSSFSHDMLSESLDPPTTVCAVNFEGGARVNCDMTDRISEDVVVGMPVEMTFRRLKYGAFFYTYWWKCRPIR